MEEFIWEDSTSNIFISIYNRSIKTHDEFFVALKYFWNLTPTEKINKKFDIIYIWKYVFPSHIFEELQYGIINSNNQSSLQEKVEKSKSRRRKFLEKIFWSIDDEE